MEFSMKRIHKLSALGIAIFGLATVANASTLTGLFIGGEGLDLQARNGDLDYITLFPVGAGPLATYAIHPNYGWGWRVYGGLTFCGNEDLTFSWMRYQKSKTVDFGTPLDATSTIIPSALRWLPEDSWYGISTSASFDVDDVYGVFGHTVIMGPWKVRYAAGVEWGKIDADMTTQGLAQPVAIQPFNTLVGYEAESHTHGFGPRVEFDFAYGMPYGLYSFIRPSVSLLIASRNIKLESLVTDPTDVDFPVDFDFTKRYVVIPHLSAKIGLGYTYTIGGVGSEGAVMDNCALTIEAGWQADSYIHAIERPVGFNNPDVNTASTSNLATKVSNLGLEGFFIGARLSTAWL